MIYKSWITILSEELQIFLVWPERDVLRRSLPEYVSIIDCFEVFIETPFGVTAQAKTWSNYKHHHTIKYLMA